MRVCTRRIAYGTASGGVIRALSASLRKIVLFAATSFFTNLSEAAKEIKGRVAFWKGVKVEG